MKSVTNAMMMILLSDRPSCEIMAINVELCSRVILVQVSLGLRVIYINLYVITEERSLNYGNLAEEK